MQWVLAHTQRLCQPSEHCWHQWQLHVTDTCAALFLSCTRTCVSTQVSTTLSGPTVTWGTVLMLYSYGLKPWSSSWH